MRNKSIIFTFNSYEIKKQQIAGPHYYQNEILNMERQYCLAKKASIDPCLVAGLSFGEFTAAIYAGILSIDTLRYCLRKLHPFLDKRLYENQLFFIYAYEIKMEILKDLFDVEIAIEFSTLQYTLGIKKAMIPAFTDYCLKNMIFYIRLIQNIYPFHTSEMKIFRDNYMDLTHTFFKKNPRSIKKSSIDFYSTALNQLIPKGSLLNKFDICQIFDQIFLPFSLIKLVEWMQQLYINEFIEISNQSILKPYLKNILKEKDWTITCTQTARTIVIPDYIIKRINSIFAKVIGKSLISISLELKKEDIDIDSLKKMELFYYIKECLL